MTPFDTWMRKSADIQPTSFESNQVPNVDTQGALVNPNPTRPEPKENGLQPLDNATTSDQDDKKIEEPHSPGDGYSGNSGGAG